MDNRSGLLLFGVLLVLFVFSFTFCWDALAYGGGEKNVLYGVYALIGFAVCVAVGFFQGILLKKDGVAISWWFLGYGTIAAIVYVWYLTRCGTVFGWW